jgi:phosphohistidine swiveling domain-containing protein
MARGYADKVASMDIAADIDHLTSETTLVRGPKSFQAEWRRDYYALFLVVRGMVSVRGAQLHHATQIARECGVPLINLPDENLSAIEDGREVEIDGSAGKLSLL